MPLDWKQSDTQLGVSGPRPGHQTVKTFTGRTQMAAGATTAVTLYTVTAGKTFYLTDLSLFTESTAGLDVQFQVAGSATLRAVVAAGGPAVLTGLGTSVSANSGQVVRLLLPIDASTNYVDHFVAGYEQ